MDDYQIITLALGVCNAIILPLGAALYRYLKRWKEQQDEREKESQRRAELLAAAQMALLRDRLMQSGEFFSRLGAIPSDIKLNLVHIGEAYVALGGNGEGHKMLEKVAHMTVDDEILKKYYMMKGEDFEKVRSKVGDKNEDY